MELELSSWFVNRNRLGSIYVTGEVERETEKAVLFNGTAIIKPSNICCRCGRLLTDPVSIQLGIGPICAEMDQRDSMTQAEKDEYIKKFSAAHHIQAWIPKSVIVNKEVLPVVEKEEQPIVPEIEAIISQAYILVKSDYKHVDLCRSIPSGKWHKEKKFWYYPYSESMCKAVVEAFACVENKDIAPEILEAASNLVKAQEVKSADELPEVPLEKRPAKKHQKQAFWFSKQLAGAALLMDMGCMKTGVAIRLIDNSDDKKVLVICPDKVVRVWPKEYKKDGTRDFVVVPCEVRGKRISVDQKAAIARTAYEENEQVIVVVNYESAWRNSMGEFIKSVKWDRIILDESHRAKQFDGRIGKFVGELKATRKNILTGTLMPHSPMDVFSQYRFLDPGVFGNNFYKFRNRYAVMGGYMSKQIVGYQNQDEMHDKIYSIAFRVTKDILDLPEENHIVRDFDLNGEAEKFYNEARNALWISLGEDRVNTDIVIVQMLRMQQITSGYLPVMEEYEDENGKKKHRLLRVEKIDSGKAELLEEIIEDIDEHEPVVVFCRFQHDLDEIKAVAERLGRTYGEISGRDKSALSDKAELQDGIQVAGVQIQAGGVGIDLTKSHYGIYYSVGYSLGDYEQSLARIHRPGQTKPVIYYHLVAAGTIDEVVYSNLKNKKDVISSIIETKKLEGNGE